MNEREFTQLKAKADDLLRKIERAKGALDEKLRILKDEFEVDSLEAANKLLVKKERLLEKATAAVDEAYQEFTTKWKDKL